MVIYGTVDNLGRPYIRVNAPGDHSALFVVDTGFNRSLLVNRYIMYRLGLENCAIDTSGTPQRIELGDYGETDVLAGIVRLMWFEQEKLVDCLVSTKVPQRPPRDNEPVGFVGTELLADCCLTIDFPERRLEIRKE